MREKCAVLLISGFLGSGKTTLLKCLLESVWPVVKPVVLINEFGKIGVDGERVRKNDLEILEINRGSIFCACAKGDFLRALYRIAREFSPRLLIVEASGVADTSDMEKDLKKGKLAEIYQLAANLCVVDAARFEDFADLFNAPLKQLKAASMVVLNKVDLVNSGDLSRVREIVEGLVPGKPLVETSFGRLDISSVLDRWSLERPVSLSSGMVDEEEWEIFIQKCLDDPDSNLEPPDRLLSQSICWEGNATSFLRLCEALPKDLVRAKGYFQGSEGKALRFDYIKGEGLRISDAHESEGNRSKNLGVFIREKLDAKGMSELFIRHGLKVVESRI